MKKRNNIVIAAAVVILAAAAFLWIRFGPSRTPFFAVVQPDDPLALTIDSSSACDLRIRRYRQIGHEVQLELASSAAGLAPYAVEVRSGGEVVEYANVPHRPGTWLTIADTALVGGEAVVTVNSLGRKGCYVKSKINIDPAHFTELLGQDKWIRQGSNDNMLDVRPVVKDGIIYLKDFANYQDGRTVVRMIDGVVVDGLTKGLPVRAGYLYSVTARWIDGPYNDWWNKLRSRDVRQQNIWIEQQEVQRKETVLEPIGLPAWFTFTNEMNIHFDTQFPEFEPVKGKLAMHFRTNDFVSPENYFKRGITHLNGSEKGYPESKLHWTATPNTFADQKADWFGKRSKEEVEALADRVPGFGAYAMDFEFWNQSYPPEVRQRLVWFSQRIHKNHPNLMLFDYWGGSAYHNKHMSKAGKVKPMDMIGDYDQPKANHTNYDPLPSGDSFRGLFNIAPVDVYAKAMFPVDAEGNTTNNFVLLSAIHSMRINQLIPYQKDNKFLFYAWNRYQPLYQDPLVPWYLKTTQPAGELILPQMEMMPASQALSLSLFSMILFDGYYLWNDAAPAGKDPNGYNPTDESTRAGREWYPKDGKTPVSALLKGNTPETPRFWDFATPYYVLGNWMSKQVEDILVGGKVADLPYELNGKWTQPVKAQALIAADRKHPFVTSVVNGKKIAILAVDSFQPPTATRIVKLKLPDGTTPTITLYGNWPALYRGKLAK